MGTRVDNLENQIFDLKEQLSFVISEMNRLEEQNKSLQAELDKEVKDNRKLVKALKEYANKDNWRCDTITGFQSVWQGGIDDEQVGNILAQDVLKEIEEV